SKLQILLIKKRMSIQLFKTAKLILNRYLVPDMVSVIINEIKEYYMDKGLEIHQSKSKLLNIEYHSTWLVHNNMWLTDDYNSFISVYKKDYNDGYKITANDRYLSSDIDTRYFGIYSISKNFEKPVCHL